MRALVLGAEGMLGSVLMKTLEDVRGTTRRILFEGDSRLLPGIDVTSSHNLRKAFGWAEPQVVINCAGIVNSECKSHSTLHVYAVNGGAPHLVARLAKRLKCRVVHISTDCVFSGKHGARKEEHEADAVGLYGDSKRVGELNTYAHCVTLRTSFVGRDRVRKRGLLEWLLAQADEAPGYTRVMWSGLSTLELAKVIGKVIADESMSGLYHVAGPVISKADLLQTLARAYGLTCHIRPEDWNSVDRSLDGSKFAGHANYMPPTWVEMAEELARDG